MAKILKREFCRIMEIYIVVMVSSYFKTVTGNEFVSVYESCQGVFAKLSPVVFILNPESISSDRPNRH